LDTFIVGGSLENGMRVGTRSERLRAHPLFPYLTAVATARVDTIRRKVSEIVMLRADTRFMEKEERLGTGAPRPFP
jgi:hypothetical protein